MISGLVALPVELGARTANRLRCTVQDTSGNTIRAKIRLDSANHADTHDALRISFVPDRAGLFQATINVNNSPVDTHYGVVITTAEASAPKAAVTRVMEPISSSPTTPTAAAGTDAGVRGPPQRRRRQQRHNEAVAAPRAQVAEVDSLACEMRAMTAQPSSPRYRSTHDPARGRVWPAHALPAPAEHLPVNHTTTATATTWGIDYNDDEADDDDGDDDDDVPAVRRERVETWTRAQAGMTRAGENGAEADRSRCHKSGRQGREQRRRRGERRMEVATTNDNSPASRQQQQWMGQEGQGKGKKQGTPRMEHALPRTFSSPVKGRRQTPDASPTRISALETTTAPGTNAARVAEKIRPLCVVTADGAVYCRRDAAKTIGDADTRTVVALLGRQPAATPPRDDPVLVSSARFKDVKKSIKAFRKLASYKRGVAKQKDARILLSTILMKKTRSSLETATVHAHVVDLLAHQHMQSSVVIREHEFVQAMLQVISSSSVSSLKSKSTAVRKAKKRRSITQTMFGDNIVTKPSSTSQQPPQQPPQQERPLSFPASKTAPDLFSGDRRADGWMLY